MSAVVYIFLPVQKEQTAGGTLESSDSKLLLKICGFLDIIYSFLVFIFNSVLV